MRKNSNNKNNGQMNSMVGRSQRSYKKYETHFINHTFLPLRIPKIHPSQGDIFEVPIVLPTEQKMINIQLKDTRREVIKEKIKTRVKEQMLNLLRKNMEQPERVELLPEEEVAMSTCKKPMELDVYVKGTSFSRFSRRSYNDYKKQKLNQDKISIRARQKQGERNLSSSDCLAKSTFKVSRAKPRRIWSSAVKTGQFEEERRKTRLSVSAVSFEKVQLGQIEPWRSFEDPEFNIEYN